MRDAIERYWYEVADLARAMPHHMVSRIAYILLDCYHKNGTVFLVGNGGSAATASHFACDLAKGTRAVGLPAFRVMPLTDNVPLLTAWANDTSYDRIFAEQLGALARPGDVVILISASGSSPNILARTRTAAVAETTTIAMTGRTVGAVRRHVDLTVRVPSDSVEMIEDAHVMVAHSVCVALREELRQETEQSALNLAVSADLVADAIV
jgi:D-sedoheptulose 7-phosphate isomerase